VALMPIAFVIVSRAKTLSPFFSWERAQKGYEELDANGKNIETFSTTYYISMKQYKSRLSQIISQI